MLEATAFSAPLWSSSFWSSLRALQWAAAISAAILMFGAVIEYWHNLKTLTLIVGKWILRRSTAFDRCAFKKILIHSIGPLLVTSGIAGDFIFEGRAFILEDRQEEQARDTLGSLQDKENAVATKADGLTMRLDGLATKVGVAKTESDAATDASAKAITASSSALTIATGAREEADSFDTRIVSATNKATEAESHLADALRDVAQAQEELNRLKTPRSLNNPSALISSLKQFSGTEYEFVGAENSIAWRSPFHIALKQCTL
jgi:hypothetical protein